MLYEIRHRTIYHYTSHVASARILTRLDPTSRSGQVVRATQVKAHPAPTEMTDFLDFFGNRTRTMRFLDLPTRLVIDAQSRVQVDARVRPDPSRTPAWPLVRAAAAAAPDLGGDSPVHMLFPSRHVSFLPAAASFAETSLGTARPILEAAVELMQRIHEGFVYDPEATDVSTPIAEVMRLRRGVCQDFAHLMIAALRGNGLPAAYVSGYLRTLPPPGKERLVGADATHAWVQVWCGAETGWIGLDPTNAVLAGADHVVLAVGRDYADVSPVAGVATLSEDHRVEVEVDVLPMDEQPAAAVVAAG